MSHPACPPLTALHNPKAQGPSQAPSTKPRVASLPCRSLAPLPSHNRMGLLTTAIMHPTLITATHPITHARILKNTCSPKPSGLQPLQHAPAPWPCHAMVEAKALARVLLHLVAHVVLLVRTRRSQPASHLLYSPPRAVMIQIPALPFQSPKTAGSNRCSSCHIARRSSPVRTVLIFPPPCGLPCVQCAWEPPAAVSRSVSWESPCWPVPGLPRSLPWGCPIRPLVR